MYCLECFVGDDTQHGLMGFLQKIQLEMELYIMSTIQMIILDKYYRSGSKYYRNMYQENVEDDYWVYDAIDEKNIVYIIQLEPYHERLAAIFRYNILIKGEDVGLFVEYSKEDIREYFIKKYKDFDFIEVLERHIEINSFPYNFMKYCVLWNEFVESEFNSFYTATSIKYLIQILKIRLFYEEKITNMIDYDRISTLQKKAIKNLKNAHPEVPWLKQSH